MRRWARAPFAASLVALGLYLGFPNRDYSYDALDYARLIEHGALAELVHPHHLAFHLLGAAFHHTIGRLLSLDAMRSVQVMNSLFGAGGLLLVFPLFRKVTGDRAVSTLLTLCLAFSYGYWFYAIEHETYVAPLFFVLLAAQRFLLGDGSRRCVVGIGLALGCATLLHQSHVLTALAFAAAFALAGPRDGRLGRAVLLLSTSAAVILPSYLLGAWLAGHLSSPAGLLRWFTLYAHTGSWGSVGPRNLPYAAFGLARAFFAVSHLQKALIVGRSSGSWLAVAALLWTAVLAYAALIARSLRAPRRSLDRQALVFAVALATVHAAFAVYWEPQNPEFWLPTLLPAFLLLAALVRWNTANRALLALALSATFLNNFVDAILPDSRAERNEDRRLAERLREAGFSSNDLLLLRGSHVASYYDYLFDRPIRVESIGEIPEAEQASGLDRVRQLIAVTLERGDRVFLSESELLPETRLRLSRRMAVEDAVAFYESLDLARSERFRFRMNDRDYVMYELGPHR
jgi:hypothetical protein